MSAVAEAPSRNGDGPSPEARRYRDAVKATMKKLDTFTGQKVPPTDSEVDRFLLEASLYGLEPLAGQIYAHWEDGVMKAVTPTDGLRVLAQRTGSYDGQGDPEWCDQDGKWTDYWVGEAAPVAARVRVHRKDAKVPTTGTANWCDFAPKGEPRDGSLWVIGTGKPAHVLSLRAEALALRKAFPAELSGLYTAEEMGLSLAALGSAGEDPADPPPVAEVPAAHEMPAEVGHVVPPQMPSGGVEVPAAIVDAPASQPRGVPARPQAKLTLAEALATSQYQRLRGDLVEALFDQLPDRLTDEQSEAFEKALVDAERAGVTPVELERLCKVALRESSDPSVRRNGLMKWIAERRGRADASDVPTTPAQVDASAQADEAEASSTDQAPRDGVPGPAPVSPTEE